MGTKTKYERSRVNSEPRWAGVLVAGCWSVAFIQKASSESRRPLVELSLRAPGFGARNLLSRFAAEKQIPRFARDDNPTNKISGYLAERRRSALRPHTHRSHHLTHQKNRSRHNDNAVRFAYFPRL